MNLARYVSVFAIAGVLGGPAHAFNVFPYPVDQALKWGDNTIGTPGGVVTWSLMPEGTPLAAVAPAGITGASNLNAVFGQVGGQAAALSMIQSAFDSWSAVANIQFQYVGVDDGTPFNAPYASGQSLGSIRIGAFHVDSFSAAFGYAAPPNGGTTLEGDLIFNARPEISLYVAPGNEGELYDLYPPGGGLYRNDFQGLVAHEIGHALGLAHTNVTTALMCGYVDGGFDGSQCYWADPDLDGKAPITRLPGLDDVAGIQYLYGPAPVPEPGTWAMLLAGLGVVSCTARRRELRRRLGC